MLFDQRTQLDICDILCHQVLLLVSAILTAELGAEENLGLVQLRSGGLRANSFFVFVSGGGLLLCCMLALLSKALGDRTEAFVRDKHVVYSTNDKVISYFLSNAINEELVFTVGTFIPEWSHSNRMLTLRFTR